MLLPLRQHVIRDRDRNVRDLLGEDRLYALLMVRYEIGVEQHHGDRIDLAADLDLARERADFAFVEPLDGLARRPDALIDLEGVPPPHKWLRFHPGQVVVVPAIAPPDERHVLEAAGRHIGDRRALALEQGVGGDRGAESHPADAVDRAEGLEAGHDPFDRILGRRQVFPRLESLAVLVVGDEVRERTPDIDAQTVTHGIGSLLPQTGETTATAAA